MAKGASRRALPNWIRFEGDGFTLNSAATARFFGVTPRTLSDWAKRGAPKEARGWWDPRAIMDWLGKATSLQGQEMSLEARKLKADAEYREARAEREQRTNAILEGQYIAKDEVEDEWARRVTEVKTGLLALSNKIAGQISDSKIRLEVEQVMRE
ncbi:MAG: hypothetical protein ACOX20_06385 [Limnochordia bacterium]